MGLECSQIDLNQVNVDNLAAIEISSAPCLGGSQIGLLKGKLHLNSAIQKNYFFE